MGALMDTSFAKRALRRWCGGWHAGVLTLLALPASGFTQSNPDVPIGQVIDAVYVDRYWQERRLAELRSYRAVVVYFATVECPMVARTMPKIGQLAELGRHRDFAVLVVNVGAGDAFVEAVGQVTLGAPQARFAWDRPQGVAAACGVQRTNTAVVLDATGQLRYRGKVDSAGYNGPASAQAKSALEAALEKVLDGRPLDFAETSVAGCLLTPPKVLGRETPPTYFGQILPLLDRACISCHWSTEATGIRLFLPEDVEKHANMLAEVMDNGRMPPWCAAGADVPLVNQRSVTDADRTMVRAWIAAGMPRGEDHFLPRHPPHLGWQVGEVDRVLELGQSIAIPESGVSEYLQVVFPDVFREDTWVAALEVRTQMPRSLRHCNIAFVAGDDYEPSGWVANISPHSPFWQAWPGTALRIPAGHRLALQVYHEPVGVAGADSLAVGLRYPRWEVRREVQVSRFEKEDFAVPAGDPAFRLESAWIAPKAGEGVGIYAQMHGRGRDVRVVLRQDKVDRTVLWVPTYSFAMQSAYAWPRGGVVWAAGSSFQVAAHYDNSVGNPANPDPGAVAKPGSTLRDERLSVAVVWLPREEDRKVKVDVQSGVAK